MLPRIRIFASLALAALAVGTPASASVDSSPKPGGVYRLKPGTFVRKGVSCAHAPNSAIRQYDGRGISDAYSRGCRARILSRKGDRYTVMQSCIGAGVGAAPRVSERQTVTVPDALTFTLKARGPAATYRYCPVSMTHLNSKGPKT